MSYFGDYEKYLYDRCTDKGRKIRELEIKIKKLMEENRKLRKQLKEALK